MNSEHPERANPGDWDGLLSLSDADLNSTGPEVDVQAALNAFLLEVMTRVDEPSVPVSDGPADLDVGTAVTEAARGLARRRAERGDYLGTMVFEQIAAENTEAHDPPEAPGNPVTGLRSVLGELMRGAEDDLGEVPAGQQRRPADPD